MAVLPRFAPGCRKLPKIIASTSMPSSWPTSAPGSTAHRSSDAPTKRPPEAGGFGVVHLLTLKFVGAYDACGESRLLCGA